MTALCRSQNSGFYPFCILLRLFKAFSLQPRLAVAWLRSQIPLWLALGHAHFGEPHDQFHEPECEQAKAQRRRQSQPQAQVHTASDDFKVCTMIVLDVVQLWTLRRFVAPAQPQSRCGPSHASCRTRLVFEPLRVAILDLAAQ